MKVKLHCKSMEAASDLHNALVECLVQPRVGYFDVKVEFGGHNDWHVGIEHKTKEKAPDT